MDCNKEEAIRAKEIAEKKMQGKDFLGARKIILRAQQLFPDLENVPQMLTVCDVHCSAELNKAFDSERDWYGILQVDQTADEASIKKQYRKLALLLHPDKNKFAGAEEAFKLIGDGHRVLSDQAKRSFYDMKRKIGPRIVAAKQPPPQPNRNPHARKQPAVKTNFADRTVPQFMNLNPQQQQHQNQSGHRTSPQFMNLNPQQQQNQSELPKCPTFWSSCPFCGVKSQYYRTIMGRAIQCHKCRRTFIPQDMFPQGSPLGGNSGYASWNPSGVPQQDDNFGHGAHKVGPQYSAAGNSTSTRFHENVSVRETFSKTEIGGKAKSEAQEDGNADKRAKFEAKKNSEVNTKSRERKKSENESRKRTRKVTVEASESCENTAEDVGTKDSEGASGSRYPRRSTRHKPNVACNISLDDDDDDFVEPPSSKRSTKNESSGVADGQCSESSPLVTREGKHRGSAPVKEELPNEKEQVGTCKTNGSEQVGVNRENRASNFDANSKENLSVDSSVKTKSDVEAFEYPDPEFYDFDKDRNKDKFKVEQIWAIYDDTKEGMPRYYARIRKVLSPFMLRITWLEYAPEDEDEISSCNRKWPIALGTFRLGDTQSTDDPIFSHLVSWEKGTRDRPYKIYPRKGEIWAIYKNSNIKRSSDLESPIQYGYEIVEVFSDYAEGDGFSVAYLAKVDRCVFRRQSANNVTVLFQIPSREIFRFSHKIPSYEITGAESRGVPEGSLELDPASLPKEFVNCGKGREGSDRISAHDVGLCSNSAPRKGIPAPCSQENPTPPKRSSIEPNEKNIQEKQSPEKRKDCSRTAVDGAHEKKPHQANANGSMSPNANKEERHLEAKRMSPNVTQLHTRTIFSPREAVKEDSYSEFHNFNADRLQEIFRRDQLWALYSNIDGMPYSYARIRKIELPDFKVHVRWLEVCPVQTKEIKWVNMELPISCGTFKLSHASDCYSDTNKFSHRVRAKANHKRNRYEIYPRVGDVWAVYKNWSCGWTSSNLENCEYEMVEILTIDGYSVKALVLEKLDGFKNVFGIGKAGKAYPTIEIPHDKLQSLSHWVPAFRLTEERCGNLKGYWELDPAAMPSV